MKKEATRGIRLGIFVLAGTVFLIAALYLIGNKRDLFSKTFTVKADFYDVGGLMPGNNVRFSGIDVGTVDDVRILHGTAVTVTMIIEERYKTVIRKNAIAAIGTDGLMGNKLVNIDPVDDKVPFIDNGDVLATRRPVETDAMIRTLDQTNNNMKSITDNLKTITEKINNSNSLWNFLSDTIVADDIRKAIVGIRMTGQNSAVITGDLSAITQAIRTGKGTVGTLLFDTTMTGSIRHAVVNISASSDTLAVVSGNLSAFSDQIRNGKGTVGTLVMDTAAAQSLIRTLQSVETGAAGFSENMEALKHNVLLRRYFRKQEKKTVTQQKTTTQKTTP